MGRRLPRGRHLPWCLFPGRFRHETEAFDGEGRRATGALARRGISSGSIDGVAGAQTRAALRVFQKAEGLSPTGEPDSATLQRLGVGGSPYGTYTVTAEDLASLTSVPRSWLEKSRKGRLGYESVLELVAERSHAHPRLIRGLNPDVDWGRVYAGKVVRVPALVPPEPRGKPALVP